VSNDTAELLAAISATAVGVMALVGAAVRFALLPWLRDHLVGPLLDRLDTLAERLEGLNGDMRVATRMYEGHIELSGEDRARLWDAIAELRDAANPRHRRTRRTRREDRR
jgi:hypothetical protein